MYTKKDYAVVLVSVVVVLGLIFIWRAKKDDSADLTPEDSVVEIGDSSDSNVPKVPVKAKVPVKPTASQPALGTTNTSNEEEEDNSPKQISESQAREIAQKRMPGEVTSVTKDEKAGKIVYIVEINGNADNGSETRVIIDAYTGEIVATEN